jgi:hypothetical protein
LVWPREIQETSARADHEHSRSVETVKVAVAPVAGISDALLRTPTAHFVSLGPTTSTVDDAPPHPKVPNRRAAEAIIDTRVSRSNPVVTSIIARSAAPEATAAPNRRKPMQFCRPLQPAFAPEARLHASGASARRLDSECRCATEFTFFV